jgi:Pentapeptide repeats (8 copies)
MVHSRIALLAIGVVLISQAAPTERVRAAVPGAAVPVCGLKPSPDELANILKKHAEWLKDGGRQDPKLANDPRRANLCGADLKGADLKGANLSGADLSGAHLRSAYLGGASLSVARGEHLMGADLSGANLGGAHLGGAQVSKAKLAGVDLTGATYAPVSEPPDPYVAGIKGLATLNAASGEEIGLIQLRKLLKDAGLSDSEREATFSIQRNITRDQLSRDSPRSAQIEGSLRTVGLEWTTAYGLHPERALRWILLLGAVLTPVYMFAMLRPTAASGVMRVFPADRLEGTAGDPADEEKRKKQLVHAQRWRDAVPTAAYFSLISAVNIDFEQFTPGDWIRRLQTREYSLGAVGWVRVVAGAQALLSVYLLAMWALTQFGQPFE